ncbi:MAG: SDR family oxidoreductase [Lachnospiraceae bacterium]
MMKVLLIGGSGFLGSRVRFYYENMAEQKWKIIAPSHEELQLERPDRIRAFVESCCPKMIIHCGGIADTQYVVKHPEESRKVTVEGSKSLAVAAAEGRIPFLLMSSDYVYQGRSIWGKEYDEAKDAFTEEEAKTDHEYGRQKLEAEEACLALYPETIALRLTWMYDFVRKEMKNKQNFLTKLLEAAKEGKPAVFACYEYRGITDVWQVVRNLERAAKLPGGSYNFGSSNTRSTAETAQIAAEVLGISQELIARDREKFSQRPRNLTMSTAKINQYRITFPTTEEGLKASCQSFILDDTMGKVKKVRR